MDEPRTCKDCGAPIAPEAPEGLCPKCLMRVALGTQVPNSKHQTPKTKPAEPSASSPADDPLLDPAKLAACFPQLEILELLGKGRMGAVYKARQPALDRLVALKILPHQAAGDPGFAERFNREARALAKLNHPNIVAVYDFGQADGLHFFIMELVDGANLRQIERAGKLSAREALKVIPQICEALQYAHDEGIVHRDIKPENVLLDKKGQYSATLNQPVPPGQSLCLTSEGTITGLVKSTGKPGVFEYSMRHWPQAHRRTRRIELHRLPPGARLLDKMPGDLQERTRDGRIELVIDRLIPPGDSLEIIYHYRLAAPGK